LIQFADKKSYQLARISGFSSIFSCFYEKFEKNRVNASINTVHFQKSFQTIFQMMFKKYRSKKFEKHYYTGFGKRLI